MPWDHWDRSEVHSVQFLRGSCWDQAQLTHVCQIGGHSVWDLPACLPLPTSSLQFVQSPPKDTICLSSSSQALLSGKPTEDTLLEVSTLNCYCLFTLSLPTQWLELKDRGCVFYSSLHLQLGDGTSINKHRAKQFSAAQKCKLTNINDNQGCLLILCMANQGSPLGSYLVIFIKGHKQVLYCWTELLRFWELTLSIQAERKALCAEMVIAAIRTIVKNRK